MLGNNETIQNVNKAELFAAMVSGLPWKKLCEYVNGNSALQKQCTLGGHRMDPNQRKRIETLVNKEAARSDFSEAVCNGVFAVWYSAQGDLNKNLEDYFRSEEYKAFRTENKLSEEDYVLPQQLFEKFYNVSDVKAWTILLVFSPLKFSAEQAAVIQDRSAGSAELVERVAQLEAQLAEAQRRADAATANAERSRKQADDAAAELQKCRREQRQLTGEIEALKEKVTSAAAENRRMAAQLNDTSTGAAQHAKEVTEKAERESVRLQAEVARIKSELNGWQNKYQEQLQANRQIVANAQATDRRSDEVEAARQEAMTKLEESRKFVDLLLDRIDWSKLSTQLKLTPTMRRNFNSMIKRLNYESDMSLTIEGTLPQFWGRLSQGEAELINAIAQSNTLEVQNGDMAAFWESVKGSFAEVQSSLEARLFMVEFLYEVLFAVYMPEQLEEPVIPASPKKGK